MRNVKNLIASSCAVAAFAGFAIASAPAQADVVVSAQNPSLCLDFNQQNNNVALWQCHGGPNQNFFTGSYGQQSYAGRCLDQISPNQGAGLVMAPCQNKPSQRWSVVSDPRDPNAGRLRNEAGWCVNIPGGNANPNVQLIAWGCQRGLAPNDMWGLGTLMTAVAAGVPQPALAAMNQVGMVWAPSVAGIVAQGGGNIVAQGGGNIVAQGGGNVIRINSGAIVAQGGGNLVAQGGGNIVAQGGGNLIPPYR